MNKVEVVWEDARQRTDAPWNQPEWEYVPFIVRSIGYVVYEGPEGILLTDSCADGWVGQVQQIPSGMIREVFHL